MLVPPIDVAVLIRDVNASNEAVEDQCLRARQAADIATRSARAAELWRQPPPEWQGRAPDRPGRTSAPARVAAAAGDPRADNSRPGRRGLLFRRAGAGRQSGRYAGMDRLVPGRPGRRRSRPRLLPGPQPCAPGRPWPFSSESSSRCWAVLRFWFLATIGTGGLVPAVTGASLFTVATAGFLSLGYRALRAAETPQAWHARRAARTACQAARAARATADRDARDGTALSMPTSGTSGTWC